MIAPRDPLTAQTRPDDSGTPRASPTGLSEQEALRLARVLRAAADPTRLQILALLAAGEPEALSVADLTQAVNVSQSTVSHHLKILLDVHLVTRQNRGTFHYYRSATDALNAVGHVFLHGPVAFTA